MTNSLLQAKTKLLSLVKRYNSDFSGANKEVVDAFTEDIIVELQNSTEIETPRLLDILSDTFGIKTEEQISDFTNELKQFISTEMVTEDAFCEKDFADSIDIAINQEDQLGQQLFEAIDAWCASKGIEQINTVLLTR